MPMYPYKPLYIIYRSLIAYTAASPNISTLWK